MLSGEGPVTLDRIQQVEELADLPGRPLALCARRAPLGASLGGVLQPAPAIGPELPDAEVGAHRERLAVRTAPFVAGSATCRLVRHRRRRFLAKNSTFAGRSAMRRIRYGYQSRPKGVETSTPYPRRARSSWRWDRMPWSIWNSNRSFAIPRARVNSIT